MCEAQEVKSSSAVRTENSPKIDGVLNDLVWKEIVAASGFIEFKPLPGRIERQDRRTEVKIVYDNSAIYIGARMYDEPDSVFREIMPRDHLANSDFIGIIFDTYLDRINAFGFYVSSTGTQFDAKYSNSGSEDNNWDAVWDNILLRGRIKQEIVDMAKRMNKPELLEAKFNALSNNAFHSVSEKIMEESGIPFEDRVFPEWKKWMLREAEKF